MRSVLLLSCCTILFSVSAVAQQNQTSKNVAKESSYGKDWDGDHPERALEQEVQLTKDPALGYVPKERLVVAMELSKQQRSNKKGNAPQLLSTASWMELGPNNIGGRTRALMFDPNDVTNKKIWAGGVDGGLWVTNDITIPSPIWSNVNDFWANLAITCITYSPVSPQEFYVGTGEGWFNSDAVRGLGIWKTTDGGLNWNQLAFTNNNTNFEYVQKIVVHPITGAVFAATRSQYCDRGGVFRSLDGGTTWTLVLGTQGASCPPVSNCHAADIEIGSDGTMYASLGIGYTGSIHKSIDAGTTWTNIGGNGFPTTGYRRIEIGVAPSNANRIYAMVQSSASSLLNIYTSANKGATWTTCTLPSWIDQNCGSPSTDMTRNQAWYDLIVAVDPNDANTLLVGGVDIMKSTNAGTSWTQISSWAGACGRQYMHADQHAIIYQPGSSSKVVFGNDGGVYYSTNMNTGSITFNNVNNGYNVTQFYSCAIHPASSQSYFLAGAQDNGTQLFTAPGMNATTEAHGGDGAFCFIDQTNSTYQISSYVYNNFYRSTDNWATETQILSSTTNGTVGRFINPADYDDANHILYSAYSTTQVSRVAGVTNPVPNAEVRITVTGMSSIPTHIRVSPYAPFGTTTLFVGTGNGSLYKVTNAHASPTTTNITGTGAPWGTTASISCLEIGATENDLIATFSNYGVVSVWRSTNGGSSWSNKEGNLPDMPIRWAVYNPNDLNEVYLATELGVWSTSNITIASPVWVANNNNLANVSVRMFQMRNSDKEMIAATHGRGLFITRVFSPPPSQIPTAAFTSDLSTVLCGGNVTFTDQSTEAFEWLWDFGDQTTSEFKNPVHNFTTPGVYNVKLTVTNILGSNFIIHPITVNPPFSLNVSATPSSVCTGGTSQLNAIASGSASKTYSVSNITFAPEPGTGTLVNLSDDQMSNSNPIGFTFNFYGQNYSSFYISSNGLITFSPGMPASPVYGAFIPSSADPDNFIALAWNDLNPQNAGSTISYFTTGITPNQKLIVKYNTSHYGGVSYPFIVQAILYEGTNVIEIHTTTISNASAFDASATTTQGVENANGTAGVAVPGRNGVVFSASNDAYRFTPIVPYSYSWQPGNLNGPTQNVNPVVNTTYTVQVSDGSTCVAQSNTVSVTVVGVDDGNACTIDNCNTLTGIATHDPVNTNDGNACTLDGCNTLTGIYHNPITCNDGNVCNGIETCHPILGCQPGTPLTCDDGNICNGIETCHPVLGCQPGAPLTCDDGNVCNGIETCHPDLGCQSGTPLTCDDGNVCNGIETCHPVLGCQPGTPLTCDDGNVCNGIETCNPVLGCQNGTTLITDDSNACTDDGCNTSSGVFHNPVTSDDGNACTDDGCNTSTGVYHNPIATDDGNACTDDGCNTSTGVYHNPIDTDDGNACTDDGCNTSSGVYHNPIDTDDGNACTDDGCNTSSGVYHNPVDTDDGNACTDDGCNTLTGVYHNPINCGAILSSNILLQGYYNGGGTMVPCMNTIGVTNNPLVADVITINAMLDIFPYNLIDSQTDTLYTNGDVTVTFDPAVLQGSSYYLKINHRNSLETWSAAPVVLGAVTTYSFSSAVTQALFSIETASGDGYALVYTGDITQDFTIDATDFLVLDPEIQAGLFGYFSGDLNGDGAVDASDFLILDPNIILGVASGTP